MTYSSHDTCNPGSAWTRIIGSVYQMLDEWNGFGLLVLAG